MDKKIIIIKYVVGVQGTSQTDYRHYIHTFLSVIR